MAVFKSLPLPHLSQSAPSLIFLPLRSNNIDRGLGKGLIARLREFCSHILSGAVLLQWKALDTPGTHLPFSKVDECYQAQSILKDRHHTFFKLSKDD